MSGRKVSKSTSAQVQPLKKSSKTSISSNKQQPVVVDDGNHGILEGISSLHSWIKTQTMIRPAKLGSVKREGVGFDEDDEDDDIVISLTSKDPNISTTQVRWDHTMGEFVGVHLTETLIDHLDIDSIILHMDTEEARLQMMEQKQREAITGEKKLEPQKPKISRRYSDDSDLGSDDGFAKLANQFSFIERATQTPVRVKHEIHVQTEPPPRANFTQTVNQWVIFDFYEKYEREKDKEEGQNNHETIEDMLRSNSNPSKKKENKKVEIDFEANTESRMLKSAKILERMVNLNTYDEIAQDFRFWEDHSDEFKDTEGSLLPLWRFSIGDFGDEDLEVTGLCWNPVYSDLFAVCYGSYDFYKQQNIGYVCLYSLKNPSYPEWLCQTNSGVMCVDMHPRHPHMLVCGLHDGNVSVYNLHTMRQGGANICQPTYISSANNGKHSDVVWRVHWANDTLEGYLNFYSVSADGKVINWTLVKSCLSPMEILTVQFNRMLFNLDEKMNDHKMLDGARALAFKPDDENIFLVGTEEGEVVMATTQYSSQYLQRYSAHATPIYNIQWNSFMQDLFITCAFEFIVKIWHKDSTNPVWRFDVGSQVGDIAWAPYSSTVFAVVTFEGKVYIYDLSINKYNPICIQTIVSKKQGVLNHVAFNREEPVIVVGDSRGHVHTLKLSPNLRKRTKDAQAAFNHGEVKLFREMERRKIEKIVDQVMEPISKDRLDSDGEY